jgi:hypothetical protein
MYSGKVFNTPFGGYEYWADYEETQIDSLADLLKDICERNDMSLTMSKNTTKFDQDIVCKASIVSCANLNKDSRSLPFSSWVLDRISSKGFALAG